MTREPADVLLEVLAQIGWHPYARVADEAFFDLSALGVVSHAHVTLGREQLAMDIYLRGTVPPSQRQACDAVVARWNERLAVGQLVPGETEGSLLFRHRVELPASTLDAASIHALVIESLETVEGVWDDVGPMLMRAGPGWISLRERTRTSDPDSRD